MADQSSDGGGDAARGEGGEVVIWHDLECGSYTADLALWEEMASERHGEVLDLGCGTGRVALHLARRGHRVLGVDDDPVLVAELSRRAAEAGLPVTALRADARELDLGRGFDLILAPMQLVALFDSGGRARLLAAVARHLSEGGSAALAILSAPDSPEWAVDAGAPLPDVGERAGWVYSSLPLPAIIVGSVIEVPRLRQTVSPRGVLREERSSTYLHELPPEALEVEITAAGLSISDRREIPPSADHVGSRVIIMER